MTRQEMFNKAYLGVMRQGALCKDSDGLCLYHHHSLRCGVGHLLSKDQLLSIDLRPKLNKTPVEGLVAAGVLPEAFDTDFGIAIQQIHDLSGNIEGFHEKMKILADKQGLTVPSLQPIEALS